MPDWHSWLGFAIALAVAIGAAALITVVITLLVRTFARRKDWPSALVRHARAPFRGLLVLIGLWVAVAVASPASGWWTGWLDHAFRIAVIGAGAWLLAELLLFAEDLAVARYRIDMPDNRVARRIRTQMLIVRRLTIVVIVVVAVGTILLTFPAVRTVGASLLASAGVASIVAGLAAQSILANMFAGMQLAFSNALRVDDVVVVEGEWGRIGEITLSYVVVNLWDERRLVLPCTYFTTQPFENWTRQSSQLLGAVEFDLDWRVSTARMRERLGEVLERTPLWDRRTQVLQVTDAVGGFVRVRILVTAKDAPTLFDLRCFVREEMVAWLQEAQPEGLPQQRVRLVGESTDAEAPASTTARVSKRADPASPRDADGSGGVAGADHGALFSGSPEAEKRAGELTGAVNVVPTSRREDPESAAPS
jgi:small-conductance mechanosensitive channel